MAAMAAAASPVLKTAAGSSISAGVWTLVGVVVTAVCGVFIAIIKQWAPWQQAASQDRAADFGRLRADVVEAKLEAKAASAAVQRLENMVACMRPAISILTAEVRRLDPNNATNAAILQVQELMAMAAAGDMGLRKGLVDLATTKGAGE